MNKTGPDGFTALMAASHNGHVEVVRLLLARQGVEVNKTTQNGATALYIASQCGRDEVVQLLLARQGVEVNQSDSEGVMALFLASQPTRASRRPRPSPSRAASKKTSFSQGHHHRQPGGAS